VSIQIPIKSGAICAPEAFAGAVSSETLAGLRRVVARIEGCQPELKDLSLAPLHFGIPALDKVLHSGLAPAALHEVTPAAMTDLGSAIGFTLALAAHARKPGKKPGKTTLWIQTDFAGLEAGNVHGLGSDLFGLPARDLIIVKVARGTDALWAMEEALKCRALACVVAEIPNDAPMADLTATRRLTLAAREGGAFGFLLRHRASALTSSAQTRWRVSAACSEPDAFGGLGPTAFALSLHKNRRGPTGHWTIVWDHHECAFSTLSLGVAAAALDRPDRAPLRSAG
jgi:protein ImuA